MAGQSARLLVRFSITLNPLLRNDPTITPKQFKAARKDIESFSPSNWQEAESPPTAIALRGPQGFKVYLKDPKTLMVEVPLSFTARQRRIWIDKAATFFRRLEDAETESPGSGKEFRWITKGRYREVEFQQAATIPALERAPRQSMRLRTFEQAYRQDDDPNAPTKKRRREWLQRRYKRYSKKGCGEYDAATKVRKDLELLGQKHSKPFGPWKMRGNEKLFDLTENTILKIIRTKT